MDFVLWYMLVSASFYLENDSLCLKSSKKGVAL